MPAHSLQLREGAIIALLKNLNVTKSLCNGTRLLIRKLNNDLIEAEAVTGTSARAGMRVGLARLCANLSLSIYALILWNLGHPTNTSANHQMESVLKGFNSPSDWHLQWRLTKVKGKPVNDSDWILKRNHLRMVNFTLRSLAQEHHRIFAFLHRIRNEHKMVGWRSEMLWQTYVLTKETEQTQIIWYYCFFIEHMCVFTL